jgi:hypothetical protein
MKNENAAQAHSGMASTSSHDHMAILGSDLGCRVDHDPLAQSRARRVTSRNCQPVGLHQLAPWVAEQLWHPARGLQDAQ